MTISHNFKFIFIHVHRTGGTTITNLLRQNLGNKINVISEHGNAATSEKEMLEKHADYFTFGFVRNPWERMLSWYSLINKNNTDTMVQTRQKFQKFLALDQAFASGDSFFHYNQLDYFPTLHGSYEGIKIYSYEKFEEETHKLFAHLGFELQEIPVMNNTEAKVYKEFYTAKSKELVAQKCEKDIAYFKYSF